MVKVKEGFFKRQEALSNDNVLLAHGGHKPLSEFKIGDYLPIAGGTMTGNIYFNSVNKGIFLKDSENNIYPGIYQNNSNLWIGAISVDSSHHSGSIYISAGARGATGPTGPKGAAGAQGAAATISNNTSTHYIFGHTATTGSNVKTLYTNGPYMSGAYIYYGSDRRLKENIKPISTSRLNRILSGFKAQEFDYRDTKKHSIGYIAQELQNVLPEAVDCDVNTGMLHVDYITALVAKNAALENKVFKLEKKINKLEKMIKEINDKLEF